MNSSDASSYEIVVYYRIGILGDSKEAVSSFTFSVSDDTTLGELEDGISDELTIANLQVAGEFSQNLLDHIQRLMTEDHDEDQTEFGTGNSTSGD